MSNALRFDFIVDKDTHSLHIKREFAAKRQTVWDCYTKRELLDRWYAPKPLRTVTKSMDFREGGHWVFAMIEPSGTEHWSRTDYLSIKPIDSFTGMDGFCNDKGELNPHLPRSNVEVKFSDLHQHTLMETVVVYSCAEALQTVIEMGMEGGLKSTLECLDELLLQL
tara:strand:+ start:795 stop:1292 length:498 start_codon:yes stop_codon:yes gene_type:complete